MKVALDAMGGDNAPLINIVGAMEALANNPKLSHIFLVGDEDSMFHKRIYFKLDNEARTAAVN